MGQTDSSPPRFYRRNGRRVSAPAVPRETPSGLPACTRGAPGANRRASGAKNDRVPTDKGNRMMTCDPKPERRTTALDNASAGTVLRREGERWWRRRGLNPRPPRCERGALPTELLPHLEGDHFLQFASRCQKKTSSRATRTPENRCARGERQGAKPHGTRLYGV